MTRPEPRPWAERLVGYAAVTVLVGVLIVAGTTVRRAAHVGLDDGRRFVGAEQLLRDHEFERAELGFRQVVRDQPANPYARYYLHCSLFQQGEVKSAVSELQAAIWRGLAARYLLEPQCAEGKLILSGFAVLGDDLVLVRRADPDRPYVEGAPAPGSELPRTRTAAELVCWNARMGLEQLADRQAAGLGLDPPEDMCTP